MAELLRQLYAQCAELSGHSATLRAESAELHTQTFELRSQLAEANARSQQLRATSEALRAARPDRSEAGRRPRRATPRPALRSVPARPGGNRRPREGGGRVARTVSFLCWRNTRWSSGHTWSQRSSVRAAPPPSVTCSTYFAPGVSRRTRPRTCLPTRSAAAPSTRMATCCALARRAPMYEGESG